MASFMSEYLTSDHAYPMMVIIYMNLTLAYMMIKVSAYRKKNNIKYPTMYHKTDDTFNCYQRVHQNTLEGMPIFYSIFIPSALVYPVIASVLACIYITSRFFYAWGYYTGDPSKRSWGVFGEIGLVGLFLLLIYITLCQFGLIEYR